MNTVTENTNSMKQPEEWKPIPGYEGKYEISNWGRVRSNSQKSKGRILVPVPQQSGYYRVNLYKDSKVKTPTIHRIVAEVFLSNPNNYPEVNHKDEDKGNNYVENLEWCTHAYNSSYGTRVQRAAEKYSKSVVQLDKRGNFIDEYKSTQEASSVTGIAQPSICKCCNHKYGYRSPGGFVFMYKDEYIATQTKHKK